MSSDVFLSYDQRDHDRAKDIAKSLSDLDVRVFFDKWYLKPGTPWPQALEEALSSCGSVAIVVGGP